MSDQTIRRTCCSSVKVQWHAATLAGAWNASGECTVAGTTFALATVAPKTAKNLQDHANDYCLRVIHRSDVRSLGEQGMGVIVTPIEVTEGTTHAIHAVPQVSPRHAHGGVAAVVNPTTPHGATNNAMPHVRPRPQAVDPHSFTEWPECKVDISVGRSKRASYCLIEYLKPQRRDHVDQEHSFQVPFRVRAIRAATYYFDRLDDSEKVRLRLASGWNDGP
jgi:hypothetical protein